METTGLLPDHLELSPARRKLFAAALVLFAERGFHGVSVRDITDSLGQRPAAIYAHAPSKQHLLAELVLIGVREHRDRLREAMVQAGNEPGEQLRQIVQAHVLVNLAYPELSRLVNREARALDETNRATAQAIVQETELTLAEVVRHGQKAGAFGDVDVYLVVQALGALGIRAAEWWTKDSPRTPQQVAETYADFALSLVR